MALFEGYKTMNGTRSNTHLVKSGHMSPAEDWLLDPTFNDSDMSSVFNNGVLMKYEYGGPGVEDVVIPKGRVVGVGKQIKDRQAKVYKSTLTLPGLAHNNNTIGMAPYNFTKNYFQSADRFGGNQLSVITMDYVTLPWIPNVEASENYNKSGLLQEEQDLSINLKMPWGAVIGECQPGDYVKATPSGRLVKWNKGDGFETIVGQVLAGDFNQEPWGWMKWMLWEEAVRAEDDVFVNRSGASNLPGDYGYPFDPGYGAGNTTFEQYQSRNVSNPTGIPGLHDGSGAITGYGRNDEEYKGITILDKVPSGISDDTIIVLQAKNYAGLDLKNLTEGVKVYINDTQVDADRYTVNYIKGQITLTLKADDAGKKVTFDAFAKHYGTPSYADFKGVQGTLFVLLKK